MFQKGIKRFLFFIIVLLMFNINLFFKNFKELKISELQIIYCSYDKAIITIDLNKLKYKFKFTKLNLYSIHCLFN